MKFNESKCSVLHIGKDNPKNNYMMGHTPLKVVKKERDLGVVVSAGDTLCWEEQIRVMIEKAKQMTSWIIRNVVSRKPELLPFGTHSAGVGPSRKTRELGYYNGN